MPPTDPARLTDAQLLARYRTDGRIEWFAALYQRHMAAVRATALRYLGNGSDADDAVMQLFEALTAQVLRHEIACFRAWLRTVARNHCLMQLRRAGGGKSSDPLPDLPDCDAAESFAERSEREGRCDELVRALELLPEAQRRCLRLFYFEGLSYGRIAARTGWPPKSIKSHIQNGKRNLRLRLSGHKR